MEQETNFTITERHLKLLRKMYVICDNAELRAPMVCQHRPYGSSNITNDIGDILDMPSVSVDGEKRYIDDVQEEMYKLHEETAIALQICLRMGEFEVGEFHTKNWGHDWSAVAEC